MKGKLMFLAGGALGFVLGSRSGRDAYTKLRSKADEVWNDPKVQKSVSQASEKVKEATGKATSAAKSRVGKGGSSESGDSNGATAPSPDTGVTEPTSTRDDDSDSSNPTTTPSGPAV